MIGIVLALAAAAPLHLADLLREAHEKNPDLLAAQARVRAAQASIPPAGALDDPMLMVQLWNAPADLSNQPVMVQVSQQIPLGGKRGARTDAARADAALSGADLLAKQREIDAQVAAAWFDLFLAERTQRVDDELDQILHLLLRASEARVSTGRGEQVELLRAQGALLQLRSERETAVDQQQSAWARLSALLDRDPASPIGSTTEPRLLASLPDLATLRARALQERPELLGVQAQIAGAQAQERLARAAEIPDLGLFAAAMHTFHNPMGPSNFLFGGIQINLPLFGGGKNQPRIEGAAAQVVAMQEAGHALRNRIAAEIAEQYAHLQTERRQIELHHQLIPIARQAVESAASSYGAGRADFTTAIDSARELRMHELELAAHLAGYEQRLAELQRAAGIDLGLAQAAEGGHDEHR